MTVRYGIFGMPACFRKYPPDHILAKNPIRHLDTTRMTLWEYWKSMEKSYKEVLYMPCAGSTTILDADDPRSHMETVGFPVREASYPADGWITRSNAVCLTIPNADCPVAIVWDHTPGNRFLALLHCGLPELAPKDGGPSIIRRLVDMIGVTPHTFVKVGYGIKSCCYGLHTIPPYWQKAFAIAGTGMVTRHGADAYALDLERLAWHECREIGFMDHQIMRMTRGEKGFPTTQCTACAREELSGKYLFHSHLRDGTDAGRNLVFAYFE